MRRGCTTTGLLLGEEAWGNVADRRLPGKSDAIDAEHAARQILAGLATAVPKTADGSIESLRLLKIARDTAVKARTTAMAPSGAAPYDLYR